MTARLAHDLVAWRMDCSIAEPVGWWRRTRASAGRALRRIIGAPVRYGATRNLSFRSRSRYSTVLPGAPSPILAGP